jgi:hypothetical protein
MQSWNQGLCQIIVFVVSIAKIQIWSQGLWQAVVFVVSSTLIHVGFNWNQGLYQVIVFDVSIVGIRIDVNSSCRRWLIKISILQYAKGLNFIVRG